MPLRRITSTIAKLGWVDGLTFLLARGLSKLSARRAKIVRYYLVAQPVPKPLEASPARVLPKTRVTFVDTDDPITERFPRPPEVIAQRFRNGNLCLTARTDVRFAGFLWLARDAYDEDAVRCRYELSDPSKSAWDFDVYVEPDLRIGRTFSHLWNAANIYLASEGINWSYSRIDSWNSRSLRAHQRLGIRCLFSVTFLSFGPVQITLAGASPYIHLSLSDHSRPRFRLSPPKLK